MLQETSRSLEEEHEHILPKVETSRILEEEHEHMLPKVKISRTLKEEHEHILPKVETSRTLKEEHEHIFSNFHLKIFVIRRTKLQAFLGKQNERVKITTST